MNSKDLLVFFAEAWKEKHDGKAYPIAWGKEGAMFKRLLSFYSGDELKDLIGHFFSNYNADPSGFSARCGFSVSVFVSQVPRLVASLEQARKMQVSVKAVTTDAERLALARKSIEVKWVGSGEGK